MTIREWYTLESMKNLEKHAGYEIQHRLYLMVCTMESNRQNNGYILGVLQSASKVPKNHNDLYFRLSASYMLSILGYTEAEAWRIIDRYCRKYQK